MFQAIKTFVQTRTSLATRPNYAPEAQVYQSPAQAVRDLEYKNVANVFLVMETASDGEGVPVALAYVKRDATVVVMRFPDLCEWDD